MKTLPGSTCRWLNGPALAVVILLAFGRLVASPGALIVDGQRPGVDRATPAEALAVGNDLTRLFLPHHARIAREVAATGRIPGWDPAGFGGRPLVGNPQAGLWYPPVWIAWRFWFPAALGWLTIGHLLFGAIGIEVLARSQRLSRWASFAAGAIWAVSPYVLGQTYEGHYPHVWSASYAPWTFWAALGAMEGRTRGWLLPLLIAMSGLTGHAQETFYLVIALMGWALVEGGRRGLSRQVVGGIAVVAGVTLGLLAIEILPDACMRRLVVGPYRPTSVDGSRYHVSLINLSQWFCPFALGGPAAYRGDGNYWESLLSFGLVPTILAALGTWRFRCRPAVAGWVLLGVVSILFSLGRYFVVFDALFAITPGMTAFRVPSRALFLASVAMAMLSGYGIDAVRGLRSSDRRRLLWGILGPGIFLSLLTCASSESAGAVLRTVSDPRFLSAALAATGMSIWLVRSRGSRRGLAITFGLIAIAEMTAYGFALIQVAPFSQFQGADPASLAIETSRPEGPFRIRARDAYYGDARAIAANLEKTNLNDSFQIRRAADLYERLYPMFGSPLPARFPERFRPEVQSAVLQRMNVAFTISDDQHDEPDLGWPVLATGAWNGGRYVVRRNPEWLPKAYVVPRVEIAKDGPGVVDAFVKTDPRNAVLMEADPLDPGATSRSSTPRQSYLPAAYTSPHADRVEIRVRTTAPGLLVVADTWMTGWSATDQGRPVPILRGNRSQRVVALAEPGDHQVVMIYTPPGLWWGKAITGLSFALWMIGIPILLAIKRSRSARGRELRSGILRGCRAGESHSQPAPSLRGACSAAGVPQEA